MEESHQGRKIRLKGVDSIRHLLNWVYLVSFGFGLVSLYGGAP